MKRMFKFLGKYKKQLIIPTLALILSIALDSANPFLNRLIIDRALPDRNANLLFLILLGLLAITSGRAVLGFFKEYIYDEVGTRVYRDIKELLFDHIQSLHFKYFDNISTGELMSRLGEDLENIWRSMAFGFRLMVQNILYFIVGFFILSTVKPVD